MGTHLSPRNAHQPNLAIAEAIMGSLPWNMGFLLLTRKQREAG
jgi:hypothetical protein